MRVAVVGAGAMGCLFAARLKTAGNDVLLLDRKAETVREIAGKGVRFQEAGGTQIRVQVRAMLPDADLRSFDLVLFAVKAYDTARTAGTYAGKLGLETRVLTLQNGLGNLEVLARRFGTGRVLAGSTTEASLLRSPGSIVHTGSGRTVLGGLDRESSRSAIEVAEVFRKAGFKMGLTRNVKGVVWAKAVLNSAINPVSALTRLRNDELAEDEGLRVLMLEVLGEGVTVCRAEGVRPEPAGLPRLLSRVLRATGANQSSMLQDVLRGGPTEVRELNGAIAETGRYHGIATPYNRLLTRLVLGLERSMG